jgi:outer membrane protein assembly factor BamB
MAKRTVSASRRGVYALSCAVALVGGCVDRLTGPSSTAEGVFGRGKVIWFTPDDIGAWTMHPLVDGPRVYFSRDLSLSRSGEVVEPSQLRALDRETGAVLWSDPIISANNAAVAGGVVGAVWGSLQMFDRVTGTPTHVFRYESTSLSGNVVSDGTRFYVGSHNGHVLAVSATSGNVEWDRNLAGSPSTATFGLTLDGDVLAVTLKHFRQTAGSARDSGIVAVIDRSTGAQRWRAVVDATGENAGIVEAPMITGGLVVVVTQGHDVVALDLETGAVRWRQSTAFTATPYGSGGLTACDGMVIVPTGDLGLVALDAATGAQRWRVGDLESGSLYSLECSYGTVLARGSNMRVVDARTGAVRARYPRSDLSDVYIASATRDETSLYIGTSVGYARVAAP